MISGWVLSNGAPARLEECDHSPLRLTKTAPSSKKEVAVIISAQGEDRSDYQPAGPWTGLDFGICKATEGTGWTGTTFPANWATLKAEGKPRGAYHFLHPDLDPVAQADHFMDTVLAHGLQPGDMLWSDCEIASASADTVNLAFLRRVAARVSAAKITGIIIGTYTDHAVGQGLHQTAAAFPVLWIAWPSATAPDAAFIAPFQRWAFWQWGVRGADKDAFNGSAADLKTWIASFQPAPSPVPSPSPVPVPGVMVTVSLPQLAQGSAGPAVRHVQVLLIDAGHPLAPYGADGKFGPLTAAALRAVTGGVILDAAGWAKLLTA